MEISPEHLKLLEELVERLENALEPIGTELRDELKRRNREHLTLLKEAEDGD